VIEAPRDSPSCPASLVYNASNAAPGTEERNPTREMHHARTVETARYDCPGSWLLGNAAKLGALDHTLWGPGLPRSRSSVSRVRGRGRGPQPRSRSRRKPHGSRAHGAPRTRCWFCSWDL